MATIWWSSSRAWPGASGWFADVPRWLLTIFAVVPPDKLVHAGIYALLAALWRLGLAAQDRMGSWSFAAATLFGALDEVHQGGVPGRSSDPWDLLADAVGAALAVLAWQAVARQRSRR